MHALLANNSAAGFFPEGSCKRHSLTLVLHPKPLQTQVLVSGYVRVSSLFLWGALWTSFVERGTPCMCDCVTSCLPKSNQDWDSGLVAPGHKISVLLWCLFSFPWVQYTDSPFPVSSTLQRTKQVLSLAYFILGETFPVYLLHCHVDDVTQNPFHLSFLISCFSHPSR